jgi:hypothetical protein
MVQPFPEPRRVYRGLGVSKPFPRRGGRSVSPGRDRGMEVGRDVSRRTAPSGPWEDRAGMTPVVTVLR